ncbi:MAG TPA: hypothetical protein IGS53_10735 [Leptolyngbyaceae cyanobacterium M33_DOE_097]|uniref:Isopropylmalate/homocitrate/citramalate synthase n=1 Tax=Oscillatoriales cyanobacterium SpSt-418 TaxID=2282169 RepID=A0A7C3KGV9_9CYAN|nr:hypothetical protein [Leptolyngbyaceae cyanobacterium M33_DOE_097]
MQKQDFFYPCARYRGPFSPQNLLFNANLQEFSQRISYISNLMSNGKLSPEESFLQIESLWHQLKTSSHDLKIDEFEDFSS